MIKKGKGLHPVILLLIFFSILITIVFSVTLIVQRTANLRDLKAYRLQLKTRVNFEGQLFSSSLDKVESEILFLSRLNELQRYRSIETEEERCQIENEFIEFMKASKYYDQIRYIDKSGQELIRVDNFDGNPAAIPAAELQNKSDRYYVQETLALPEDAIYVSPFDLNIEHGKIETPLKPVIRFGTPIFCDTGELKGILIVNYLGQKLIKNLDESTKINSGTYSLLNSSGYWLYNDDPESEWGFMYPEKSDLTLMKTDRILWNTVIRNSATQELIDGVLYTSEKIKPFDNYQEGDSPYFFIILNKTSLEEMNLGKAQIRRSHTALLLPECIACLMISLTLTIITVQRNKYRTALREAALYDQLTGLPNRKLLAERGSMAELNSKRYEQVYAVLFLDLDGFKQVNDKFGHATGDLLLKEVGSILQKVTRDTDTVARFGGDEFIILLPRISGVQDCRPIAEKIISSLSSEFLLNNHSIRIGTSIGIVVVEKSRTPEFDDVILAADAAMYDVKKSGKNNYKIVNM